MSNEPKPAGAGNPSAMGERADRADESTALAAANSHAGDWPRGRRLAMFLVLLVAGCAADLATKQWAFAWRGEPRADVDNTWWIWEGYFGIQTAVNQGAVFGLGQGGSRWFAALSVVALAGIVFWLFVRGAARDGVLTFALGCISGGILGNLYDRLGLWHAADAPPGFQNGVRDWILLRYGEHTWPNFNIADSLLVCGAFLLVAHAFWPRKAESGDEAGSKEGGAGPAKRLSPPKRPRQAANT